MKVFSLLIIFFLSVSCLNKVQSNNYVEDADSQKVIYQESTEDFVNPERGFFRMTSVISSNFIPLDKNTLMSYRAGATIPGSQNRFFSSLVFRYYILDNFLPIYQ